MRQDFLSIAGTAVGLAATDTSRCDGRGYNRSHEAVLPRHHMINTRPTERFGTDTYHLRNLMGLVTGVSIGSRRIACRWPESLAAVTREL